MLSSEIAIGKQLMFNLSFSFKLHVYAYDEECY